MTGGGERGAAPAAFGAIAGDYDRLRRQLIPCFDAFYGAAASLLPLDPGAEPVVLDLGAGTGLLAEAVLRRFPRARLVLLDGAPEMLEVARARFAAVQDRVHLRAGDYAREPLGGPYDAVVSALSIHHLGDAEKRDVYARAFDALRPGGVFVNADNVLGETREAAAEDRATWVAAVRATGISEADLDAALERTKLDRFAPLQAQLGWLRAIGFADVACAFQWRHFAVFGGRRA